MDTFGQVIPNICNVTDWTHLSRSFQINETEWTHVGRSFQINVKEWTHLGRLYKISVIAKLHCSVVFLDIIAFNSMSSHVRRTRVLHVSMNIFEYYSVFHFQLSPYSFNTYHV